MFKPHRSSSWAGVRGRCVCLIGVCLRYRRAPGRQLAFQIAAVYRSSFTTFSTKEEINATVKEINHGLMMNWIYVCLLEDWDCQFVTANTQIEFVRGLLIWLRHRKLFGVAKVGSLKTALVPMAAFEVLKKPSRNFFLLSNALSYYYYWFYVEINFLFFLTE